MNEPLTFIQTVCAVVIGCSIVVITLTLARFIDQWKDGGR